MISYVASQCHHFFHEMKLEDSPTSLRSQKIFTAIFSQVEPYFKMPYNVESVVP